MNLWAGCSSQLMQAGIDFANIYTANVCTIENSDRFCSHRTEGESADRFVAAFLGGTDFVSAIERWTPDLLDEVRGIAQGAGIDHETMLAFQLFDEVWAQGESVTAHHCTAIGVPATDGQPTLLGGLRERDRDRRRRGVPVGGDVGDDLGLVDARHVRQRHRRVLLVHHLVPRRGGPVCPGAEGQ